MLRITSASRALVVHFGGYAESLVTPTAKGANVTPHNVACNTKPAASGEDETAFVAGL